MRKLRRFYTPAEIKELYGSSWTSGRWPEHTARIVQTRHIGRQLVVEHGLKTGADLSCGDGFIIGNLGLERIVTNDVTMGRSIEETVTQLLDPVDLFVCTETIEHLEAPWTVIERIAEKTKWILLSTPLDEDPAIDNYEHYWSFTEQDVTQMLAAAGFGQLRCTHLQNDDWTYTYQVWTGEVV
jgi:hypothetical protein